MKTQDAVVEHDDTAGSQKTSELDWSEGSWFLAPAEAEWTHFEATAKALQLRQRGITTAKPVHLARRPDGTQRYTVAVSDREQALAAKEILEAGLLH